MTATRIKAIVVFLLMATAFGVATAWRPTQHLADMRPKVDLESIFPKQFGDWRMDDRVPVQIVSPDQAAVLNAIYNQTLSRTYVNSQGQRVMLSVAYGGDQSDGTRAHRPEVCYPAQGFQVVSSSTGSINTAVGPVPTRRVVARLGSRIEPISYWVVVGDKIALSGTDQKLAQLGYSVRGVIPDGMLVRVSTIDANPEKAYGVHQDFLLALTKAVQRDNLPLIVGAHAAV
jgi:EpsI family protein